MKKIKLNTIPEAIEEIRNGRMVVVVDDENRENEGDLVMAAEKVTPEAINFMITHGRGLVCLPMGEERLRKLSLLPMVADNDDYMRTAFTVSVDAKPGFGVSTGISASDRAKTIEALINTKTKKEDFSRPGHIFPLIAMSGGVLRIAGHTEASLDLAKLAGLYPSGVICEIIKPNGKMARLPDLVKYARKHKLKIITIADLIHYRMNNERLIKKNTAAKLPTKFGEFISVSYKDIVSGETHLALVRGKINSKKTILVRVHSQCLTGDVFGSLRCDCGEQLAAALEMISKENGILLYMRQEGRGIGLSNKLKAYSLQDQGLDTVEANIKLGFPADLRDYGIGAQILADLGAKKINLITNNPKKIIGLEGYGLKVVNRIPLEICPNEFNYGYLRTKSAKMGHLFDLKCLPVKDQDLKNRRVRNHG